MGLRDELAILKALIDSTSTAVDPEEGLFLMPQTELAELVYDAAVIPAMKKNGLNSNGMVYVFNSDSTLAEVVRHIQRAAVIVADVTDSSDVLYVLGLAHGLGRCPIMIGRRPVKLPFDLKLLRCIRYEATLESIRKLREELTRAIRVMISPDN